MRKPSRKLTPRRSREKADRCEESPDVRVACGIGAEEYETGLITEKNKNPKNFAKEKSVKNLIFNFPFAKLFLMIFTNFSVATKKGIMRIHVSNFTTNNFEGNNTYQKN